MYEVPAQRGGAKALLLTILGEIVLPGDGAAWTGELITAAARLGINEKNARQAIARIGEQGLLEPERHGRQVRWSLTAEGRRLLEDGAERIYRFGTVPVHWNRQWLTAHCPIPESQRGLRHQLRTKLAFEGFGELSASLMLSPHVGREPALRAILGDLGLTDDSVVLRSTTSSAAEDADLVARAWPMESLEKQYQEFMDAYGERLPESAEEVFAARIELVHDWRRFPFVDPELPTELLPDPWAGTAAASLFHELRERWTAAGP